MPIKDKKWTLKECVEYALENNISIKQSELNLEATDAEAKIYKEFEGDSNFSVEKVVKSKILKILGDE